MHTRLCIAVLLISFCQSGSAAELEFGDILHTVRGDEAAGEFADQVSGLYYYRSDNSTPICNIPRLCITLLYETPIFRDVIVDSRGRIFFLSGGIVEFRPATDDIDTVYSGNALNIAIGPGDWIYFVTDDPVESVWRLQPDVGTPQFLFNIPQSPNPGFGIRQITVADDGDVFVAEEAISDGTNVGSILRWDAQTQMAQIIIENGCQGDLDLCAMGGAAWSNGKLFVSDFLGDKTMRFDPVTAVAEDEIQGPGRADRVAGGIPGEVWVASIENPFQQQSRDFVYRVNFDTRVSVPVFSVLTPNARLRGVAFYDFVPPPPRPIPVLLRRTTDSRWFSYALTFDDSQVTIADRGTLDMTRSDDYQTVSRSDFNGDGEPDVLVRDVTGGQNGRWVLYTLNDNAVSTQGFADLTRNSSWQVIATEDFNNDNNADVLLRNSNDGRWLLYLMNAQQALQQGIVALSTDLGDQFVGSGDFNDDGSEDVLLRRPDGSWLLYLMDGVNAPTSHTPALTGNTNFTVQAIADFDGDGDSDILLRRTDGRWFMYLMDGATIDMSGSPAMSENTAFSLQSDADFNGDGSADALLRRTDGSWFLYTLDGLMVETEGSLAMTRNPDFELVSDDDFSDDNRADALLRRIDGRWVLYSIDGDGPAILGQDVPGMTRNPAWVPQN